MVYRLTEESREMKVVKFAKYVGTMIGPEGHNHRWKAPRKKFIQRAKNNESSKSLVEDCATSRSMLFSALVDIGSISAPYEATFKGEAHALQCSTAGPYNAIPTNLLCVGSVCGLGPDLVGTYSVSLAARYRTGSSPNKLNTGLEKFVGKISDWEKEMLALSMARSIAEAFTIVR